jgi:epsilon-lactone hydrolase
MTTTAHPFHLLDRATMLATRSMLAISPATKFGPDARAPFDALMEKTPAAHGVSYEAAIIGGVAGFWCRPDNAPTDCVTLYLHGGAYVVGSARAYQHLASQLAQRAGMSFFVPDYRLAPEHPFPAAVEDARAAYAGLATLGFNRIAVAGDSAGGGLALILLALASVDARNGSVPMPFCAAVMSPWTDLALTGDSLDTRAKDDPLLSRATLAGAEALYLGDHDPRDPLASPLYGNLTGLPPVQLHVGQDEVLLDDACRYGDRHRAAGGNASVHIWKGMTHVFAANVAMLRAADEALNMMAAFIGSASVADVIR